jgi:hypothetical protein
VANKNFFGEFKMKTAKIFLIAGLFVMSVGICSLVWANTDTIKGKKQLLRIGVYDSRSIAVAYAYSSFTDNLIQKISKEVHEAEAKGDVETAKKLRGKMEWEQKKRHLQGFGTMPVHQLLSPIKDKLPQIAIDTKVDIIVSKWEFDYISPDADVVDITDELVKLYEPNEKTLKTIEQFKNIKPAPEEEILEHEDH